MTSFISRSDQVIIIACILVAAVLGFSASSESLLLLGALLAGLVILRNLAFGLALVIVLALLVPRQINTGTAVFVNPVSLFIPVLFLVWLLTRIRHGNVSILPSLTTKPLLLFLIAGLISLVIGNAIWDPSVPRSGYFIAVQVAQWAIFALSGAAFLLTGNALQEKRWLNYLTLVFLVIAGALAIWSAATSTGALIGRVTTIAIFRAPFWALLTSIAGGQLLFNQDLSVPRRFLLLAVLISVFLVTLVDQVLGQERAALSALVGVLAVIGMLVWLRFPQLRWLAVFLFLILAATGILIPQVYELAGGDTEWFRSGGARGALAGRVLDVTMRNPITGLGPASYRLYANAEPLQYAHIFWVDPRVSSHNNYVDVFAHTGIVGLGLFLWFMVEVGRLGFRLRQRFPSGFVAGYVNAMIAVWASMLVLMLFLDWFLPFVYNVGFPGFQASVLVWLFLGGLVALENFPQDSRSASQHAS